jgi:hypothetical protein
VYSKLWPPALLPSGSQQQQISPCKSATYKGFLLLVVVGAVVLCDFDWETPVLDRSAVQDSFKVNAQFISLAYFHILDSIA